VKEQSDIKCKDNDPVLQSQKGCCIQEGSLKGYGTVCFYPDGITNISDGNNPVFTPSNKGLFFSDVKSNTAHIMVNTVDKIKHKYTVKEYSDAVRDDLF